MPYSKQTWQTGDVVTSAKLNHMEDGIEAAGGGGFKVTITPTSQSTATSDKTSDEILEAAIGGSFPYAVLTIGGNPAGVLPLIGIMQGQVMFGYDVVDSRSVTQMVVTIDSNGDAALETNVFSGGGSE